MPISYYAVGSWDDWAAFHLLCLDEALMVAFKRISTVATVLRHVPQLIWPLKACHGGLLVPAGLV